MKKRTSEFDRECSYCGASIPAMQPAWSEQEGLTEHVECDECHRYGTVTFNSKLICLRQDAYPDNYGTDGGVRYYSVGVD